MKKKFLSVLMTFVFLCSLIPLGYMMDANGGFDTLAYAEDNSLADSVSPLDEQLEDLLNNLYELALDDESALGVTEIDIVFDAVESILGTDDMANAKAVLEKLLFDIENSACSDKAKKKLKADIDHIIKTMSDNIPVPSEDESLGLSETSASSFESSLSTETEQSNSWIIIVVVSVVVVAAAVAAVIVVRKKKKA